MTGKNTISGELGISRLAALLTFIIIFAVSSPGTRLMAQNNSKPPLGQRLTYGGSFGLQFGTITNIEVSPLIGVWLLPRAVVVMGPTWQYYKDPYNRTSIYGGRAFGRFMFIQDLNEFVPLGIGLGFYLHAEYEALSLDSDFWNASLPDQTRFWEHNTLAGLGISQRIGMRSSFNISFLWSVTQSEYQIYNNPEIRIDFLF